MSEVFMVRALLSCLAVVGALLALGAGCADQSCFSDTSARCVDAHTLGTCEGSVDAVGQSKKFTARACPAENPSCVKPRTGEAFCSAESQRSSQCAGRADGLFCAGDRLVVCKDGFLILENTCGAGKCLAATPAGGSPCAFCDPGQASPEPGCTAAVRSVCSGGAVRTCECGFVIDATACDGGQVCVSGAGPDQRAEAFCALDAQPDARCASPKAQPTFCDGATLTTCRDGFVIQRAPCARGCTDSHDGQASCSP